MMNLGSKMVDAKHVSGKIHIGMLSNAKARKEKLLISYVVPLSNLPNNTADSANQAEFDCEC